MSFFKSTFFPHTYAATVQTPQVTNNHHNAVMAAHPCGVPKKRFAKMCSLHPLDAVQGVGISQQAFCSAKVAVVYTAALLASTMRPLKTPPKFDNHFARMIVRFQVQLEVGGYFSDLFLLPFQSAFIPFAPCPHGIQNRFQAIGHKSSSDAVFYASDELFSVAFPFKPPWSFADTPMLPIQRAERS